MLGRPTPELVEETPLVPVTAPDIDPAALAAAQRGFGYTREDVKMILQPMAVEGKDAVWSMGDDTPLASLHARRGRSTRTSGSDLRR